ncbi:MAG TPA: hypothetical protein VJQ61_14240 [Sinomonas sp.]|nr:hypothetical protein [Sinomonas sp.]
MKFTRNWGTSTFVGAGFAALMLILVFVTPPPGPFGWLFVLFAVLVFTSLYSLATGRRSWLKYSGRKLAAIGLAGSLIVGFASLGVAATAMPHTSPAADTNHATGGPTAPSPAISASATPTTTPSATSTPTATPTPTPTSTPSPSPSDSPTLDPAPQAPVAQAPPPAAAPAPAPVQAPPPAAAPAPAPAQNYVTPGAFCKTSLAGTTAYSKDGVLMVCSKTPADPYYRWRRA